VVRTQSSGGTGKKTKPSGEEIYREEDLTEFIPDVLIPSEKV